MEQNKILVQQCNCMGAYGAGLSGAIAKQFPIVEVKYRQVYAKYGKDIYGKYQIVKISDTLSVANLFSQMEYGNSKVTGTVYTNEKLLVKLINDIATKNKDCKIIVPIKIGCGLAGGNWERVKQSIDSLKLENIQYINTHDFFKQDHRRNFYLLLVGSRSFNDYNLMCAVIERALVNVKEDIVIVSGGAQGADALAKRYARDNNLLYIEFPAEWDKYGKAAGYKRNEQMHQFIATRGKRGCIAFWDGESKGTAHNFELAEKYNNPIRICKFNKIINNKGE